MGLIFVDIFLSPISTIYSPLIWVQEGKRNVLASAILISNLDPAYLNCTRKDEIRCLNQYISGLQRSE